MTKAEKLLFQLLSRPTTLRYSQIKKVLISLGFEEVLAKGSHRKFKHSLIEKDLVIPIHNNECKDFYKELASKTVAKIYLVK